MAKELKLTKKNLVAAHNEIDEAISIEPPVNEKLGQDQYEKELYHTCMDKDQLDLSPTEISGFSQETQDVLAALTAKFKKGKKAAPVVEDDEDEDEEEEEIEEVDEEDDEDEEEE